VATLVYSSGMTRAIQRNPGWKKTKTKQNKKVIVTLEYINHQIS
jgi:ABC-type Fe3+-hydroxamate transport system substrate-binding protein